MVATRHRAFFTVEELQATVVARFFDGFDFFTVDGLVKEGVHKGWGGCNRAKREQNF